MITVDCYLSTPDKDDIATLLYRMTYYIESTRVSATESIDLNVILKEIEKCMMMDMGHLKGKIFTTHTGKEL